MRRCCLRVLGLYWGHEEVLVKDQDYTGGMKRCWLRVLMLYWGHKEVLVKGTRAVLGA